jgi:hypothetical protein
MNNTLKIAEYPGKGVPFPGPLFLCLSKQQ